MQRPFQSSEDEPLEELLLHCQTLASVCASTHPRSGPFNAPYGAFVDKNMHVDGWQSAEYHSGLSYEELIEMVRLEAMARASDGRIEGAALLVSVTGLAGEEAIIVQIETRRSSQTYLFPVSAAGQLEGPYEASALLPDGLCFFGDAASQ